MVVHGTVVKLTDTSVLKEKVLCLIEEPKNIRHEIPMAWRPLIKAPIWTATSVALTFRAKTDIGAAWGSHNDTGSQLLVSRVTVTDAPGALDKSPLSIILSEPPVKTNFLGPGKPETSTSPIRLS